MWKPDWAALRKLDWLAVGGIALRNVVPVAGMVVSGFGAGEIVLLYYVDTVASFFTVFALVMMYAKMMQADGSPPLDARKPGDAVKIVFSAGFLTAVFAFVCAMPLVIAAAVSGLDWKSEQLRVALLAQLLFASTAFLTMSREFRAMPEPDAALKARFGYVFARWIAVFAVCTTIYWPPVLVLTYVVASIWLEIKPLAPDEAPGEAVAPVVSTTPAMSGNAGKRGKRRRRR